MPSSMNISAKDSIYCAFSFLGHGPFVRCSNNNVHVNCHDGDLQLAQFERIADHHHDS